MYFTYTHCTAFFSPVNRRDAGVEQQKLFSPAQLQQYQAHMVYNRTTDQFETPLLVEDTNWDLLDQEADAGSRALGDLFVASTNVW